MLTLTCCQDHILTENIWFVCLETSYSGDEMRCYRCGTTNRTKTEDRATQPMEAGGWVLQFCNALLCWMIRALFLVLELGRSPPPRWEKFLNNSVFFAAFLTNLALTAYKQPQESLITLAWDGPHMKILNSWHQILDKDSPLALTINQTAVPSTPICNWQKKYL